MTPVNVLKALADESRMRIVEHLLHGTYCVRALARKVGLSESAVSQHLKVLKEARLVSGTKRGYHMHYEVNRDVLMDLVAQLTQLTAIERTACGGYRSCEAFDEAHCHVRQI